MYVEPFLEESALQVTDASKPVVKAGNRVVSVLGGYERKMKEIEARMKAISDLGLCCGKMEMRRNGAGLAVHSAKDHCPYPGHSGGQKTVGRGIRKYVSRVDVAMMRDCQSRWSDWKALEARMKEYRQHYGWMIRQLNSTAKFAGKALIRSGN